MVAGALLALAADAVAQVNNRPANVPVVETPIVAPTEPEALLGLIAAADPTAGGALATQCGICHTFNEGQGPGIGPNLYDIVGAPIARAPGFSYSPALSALAAAGGTWTYQMLDAFIAAPARAVAGTRMGFPGIGDPAERANLLAWLRTLSADPVPVGGPLEAARANAIATGILPIMFDGEQLQRGRDFFNQYCARCHAPNLLGLFDMREFGEAPALVGDRFLLRWLGRPVSDLHAFFSADTRDGYHGGFTDERYANLIAYLAERNGMAVGAGALPTDEAGQRAIGFYQ